MSLEFNTADSIIYFAYGNNMQPGVFDKYGIKFQVIGPAYLANHRLAFTRKSLTWNAGVADVVDEIGYHVWGVLFRLEKSSIDILDKKEGVGDDDQKSAYKKISVTVTQFISDDQKISHFAMTYVVVNKKSSEIPPSKAYMDSIIAGATHFQVDAHYIDFLSKIDISDPSRFRKGHIVKSTEDRKQARGIPIIRVPDRLSEIFRPNTLSVISYGGVSAIAEAIPSGDVVDGFCELDQSIRHCLGIVGRFVYGANVEIYPTSFHAPRRRFLNPRSLALRIYRPSVLDIEKQICVLHPRNIAMLGLHEGDYITILSARKMNEGAFEIMRLSRRVFSGSDAKLHKFNNEEVEYPYPTALHLDLDGRMALGFERETQGMGALVTPSVLKLFGANIVRYGMTLLVGLFALFSLIQPLGKEFNWSDLTTAGITLLLSVAVTVIVTIFDLRAKIRY